jgi:hypothetical protein
VYEYTANKQRQRVRPEEVEEYKPVEHRKEKFLSLVVSKDNKTQLSTSSP